MVRVAIKDDELFKESKPKTNKRGRRPGSPNKGSGEVRQLARNLIDNPRYRASLLPRLISGKCGQIETLLWHYAYGKPREVLEVHPNLTKLTDEELTFLEKICRAIQ